MNNSKRWFGAIESLESRRFLSLGQPDSSFSGDGVQSYPFEGEQSVYYDSSFDVAADGKIIVAATTRGRDQTSQILLARLNPGGKLDQTFASGGQAVTALSGPETGNDILAVPKKVLIQKDGKILVAGSLGGGWAVFRFNSDGSLDSSFDKDGIQDFQGHPGEGAFDMVQLAKGKILVGGWAEPQEYPSTHDRDFGLMRLKTSGALDRSFGKDGYVLTDFGYNDRLDRIALDRMGNILVAGVSSRAQRFNQPQIVLTRYQANGALDTNFGNRGKVITKLKSHSADVSSLQALTNGRILVGGSNNDDAFLMRLNRKGTIDRAFAQQGMVSFDPGSRDDQAIVLRANSKQIVVLGLSRPDYPYPAKDTSQFLITFRPDGSPMDGSVRRALQLGSDGPYQLNGGARLLPDNRVLGVFTQMTSSESGNLTFARFNQSGSIDSDFGRDGKLTMSLKGPLWGTALNVITQGDGKTVVLSNLSTPGWQGNYLLRMNRTGELDSSFGVGGRVLLDATQSANSYYVLSLDHSGNIIVAGTDWNTYGSIVQRLKPDGSADNSFGDHGQLTVAQGPDQVDQIISLAGGKLLLVGTRQVAIGENTLTIIRLNADGSVDKSFGQNGVLSDSFDDQNYINKLLFSADGKLTLVGSAQAYEDLGPSSRVRVFIARYNANGSPDASFARVLTQDAQYALDARLTSDGGVAFLARGSSDRELKVIEYKANGTAGGTNVRQAPDDIIKTLFEADGRILLLTPSSTLRLAADGSTIAGTQPGAAVQPNETSGDIIIITPDHKLLVAGHDADGDLTLWRYLLD